MYVLNAMQKELSGRENISQNVVVAKSMDIGTGLCEEEKNGQMGREPN